MNVFQYFKKINYRRGIIACSLACVLIFAENITAAQGTANLRIQIFPVPQCSDLGDNDADGDIDFPDDMNCSSPTDNTESDYVEVPGTTTLVMSGSNYTVGSAPLPVTLVIFSGVAYPNSTVTFLKDAQVVAVTTAADDGSFQLSLTGFSHGNYNFGTYSVDADGNRSSLFTIPVSVVSGATTNVSDIFIAPTLVIDKTQLKKGDSLTISGQSAPLSNISISIKSDSEIILNTKSDSLGMYSYQINTSLLREGLYSITTKIIREDQLMSLISRQVEFALGTKSSLLNAVDNSECPSRIDRNGDCRVNIIDFFIKLYWYQKASPPKAVDLNNDGKVDLTDFSIMAFYWTG
ncbi:MAG: dockerin type I domain-containing protein [Patescibacteria group bacterium]